MLCGKEIFSFNTVFLTFRHSPLRSYSPTHQFCQVINQSFLVEFFVVDNQWFLNLSSIMSISSFIIPHCIDHSLHLSGSVQFMSNVEPFFFSLVTSSPCREFRLTALVSGAFLEKTLTESFIGSQVFSTRISPSLCSLCVVSVSIYKD